MYSMPSSVQALFCVAEDRDMFVASDSQMNALLSTVYFCPVALHTVLSANVIIMGMFRIKKSDRPR